MVCAYVKKAISYNYNLLRFQETHCKVADQDPVERITVYRIERAQGNSPAGGPRTGDTP